ncbi:MAG: D-alanyl-D-alanine carboxypeptidase [Solirubrobacterales bacterium]|nr:D-alanyl-D-alanine carboxypeptidase [Solirubrobacterales bacterium]
MRGRLIFLLCGALTIVGIGVAVLGAEALDTGSSHTAAAAAGTPTTTLPVRPARRIVWGVTKAPVRHRVHPSFSMVPKAGILIDLNTGEVMWTSRADWRRPIASLTKLMTALISTSRPRMNREIGISSSAANISGSVVGGLGVGSRISVRDLLKGMLIVSGNDAATALAQGIGPGERNFVRQMNRRAKAMHLKCTHYVSPVGLSESDQSCARDLAFQARALLANRDLRNIVHTVWTRMPIGNGRTRGLYNRNPLMRSHYPGITGIKTGHTNPAGYCLVASAKRGNRRLLAVVLGEEENGREMAQLLNAGFAALKR